MHRATAAMIPGNWSCFDLGEEKEFCKSYFSCYYLYESGNHLIPVSKRGYIPEPPMMVVLNFPGREKHVPESEELTFAYQMPSLQRYSLIQVNLVRLHTRLISRFVWVPSVDGKLLDAGSCGCSCLRPSAGLTFTKFTRRKKILKMQDKASYFAAP